ncbi:MAG TPA: hypothetical protein PKE55_12795 [Kiritimatiellia bacterium]|nr:hypothetical protein [Kiritimatiellia bacterium]
MSVEQEGQRQPAWVTCVSRAAREAIGVDLRVAVGAAAVVPRFPMQMVRMALPVPELRAGLAATEQVGAATVETMVSRVNRVRSRAGVAGLVEPMAETVARVRTDE